MSRREKFLMLMWLMAVGLFVLSVFYSAAPQSATPAAQSAALESGCMRFTGLVGEAAVLVDGCPFDPTAAAVVTATPVPSATASSTPVPTSSPAPSTTPVPSATPAPAECTGVPAIGWYVRAAPDANALRLAYFAATDAVGGALPAIGVRPFELLAYNNGWYAFTLPNSAVIGWTYEGSWSVSGPCAALPLWPAGTTAAPRTGEQLTGFHGIVGMNNYVVTFANFIGGLKSTTHTQDIAYQLKAANPNVINTFRSLHTANGMVDGPSYEEWYNPDLYYQNLRPYLPDGFEFYEFINEWELPRNALGAYDWPQWERFTIRMLELFAADGKCALFGSFGPGAPDIPGWPYVVHVLEWVDQHPCGTNKYHGWATHTALLMPPDIYVPADSYINNEWIVNRDLFFYEAALQLGYDLQKSKGGVYVTEGGWTDYTVLGDRYFSCEEVAAGWNFTLANYLLLRPWVKIVYLWTLTRDGDPRWFNMQPCLPLIAIDR